MVRETQVSVGITRALASVVSHEPFQKLTCDINNRQKGRDFRSWFVGLAKPVKTRVRNRAASFLRVDGTEGEVLRGSCRVGQGIEGRGLADIGQTNNADYIIDELGKIRYRGSSNVVGGDVIRGQLQGPGSSFQKRRAHSSSCSKAFQEEASP